MLSLYLIYWIYFLFAESVRNMAKGCRTMFEEPPVPDWNHGWNAWLDVWPVVGPNVKSPAQAVKMDCTVWEWKTLMEFLTDGRMEFCLRAGLIHSCDRHFLTWSLTFLLFNTLGLLMRVETWWVTGAQAFHFEMNIKNPTTVVLLAYWDI